MISNNFARLSIVAVAALTSACTVPAQDDGSVAAQSASLSNADIGLFECFIVKGDYADCTIDTAHAVQPFYVLRSEDDFGNTRIFTVKTEVLGKMTSAGTPVRLHSDTNGFDSTYSWKLAQPISSTTAPSLGTKSFSLPPWIYYCGFFTGKCSYKEKGPGPQVN